QQIGCEVTSCSGVDLLECVESGQPQLILLELDGPEMVAYAALGHLRDSNTGKMPVVALRTSRSAADEEQALVAGCTEMFYEPLDDYRLLETIGRLLQLEFEYARIDGVTAQPGETSEVFPSLAAMAESLREELADAAEALDMDAILAISERIKDQFPAEANLITHLVDGFCFDKLKELCADAKKHDGL
ncbi:MAG: hypothetical protein PHH11_15065, partial [Methylomonas sp.]|nr:hypothetical protein [Methylomonas sp.]